MIQVPHTRSASPAAVVPILEVEVLARHYGSTAAPIRAVDGVSFHLARGETLGLVGESGCGKTTLVRTLLGLDQRTGGSIRVDGVEIDGLRGAARVAFRRKVQVVFQDPYASFNPRMRVDRVLMEPLLLHPDLVPPTRRRDRIIELLEQVGLRADQAERFPGELSGGQRQRLGIARALALEPEVLVCDEPVSALDVSVQAQVINLIARLQREWNLAVLFVAHDLAVVRHVSDRVMVMYLGRVVETGPAERVFKQPAHPYTRALLSAVPIADPRRRGRENRIILEGSPPTAAQVPSGCPFHPRCWKRQERCVSERPALMPVSEGTVACHYPEKT